MPVSGRTILLISVPLVHKGAPKEPVCGTDSQIINSLSYAVEQLFLPGMTMKFIPPVGRDPVFSSNHINGIINGRFQADS